MYNWESLIEWKRTDESEVKIYRIFGRLIPAEKWLLNLKRLIYR